MLNRNGRYFSRIVIPVALRPYLDGKTELRESLGGDRTLAKRKHHLAIGRLQEKLGQAEQRRAATTGTAPREHRYPLTAGQMARRSYTEFLEFDAQARQQTHLYASMEIDADRARRYRAGYIGLLTDAELQELVGPMIERFRSAGNHTAQVGSVAWRQLAMMLCEARWEAFVREDERNEGDFSGRPLAGSILAEVEPAPVGEPVTFDAIIDAEVARRAKGRNAKPLPALTVRKYKYDAKSFTDWRRSTDAQTVTADEGVRWIAALQDADEISNRTVKAKFQNVRTVLNWGRQTNPKDFHPSGNPLNGLRTPDYTTAPSDLRAFTMTEAATVLKAARLESKPLFRWIPWLCAYSGMRVSEAGNLRKEDFFKSDDRWFWRVTTAGGRTLKTESSERRIPVHKALADEGFLDFVEKASGRLFRGETKEAIAIQPRVGAWVRELIPVSTRPDLSPNHGWRHLFEDLCRRDGVGDDARNYITGRATGRSQELYGRSDVMLPGLAAAMDQIKPYQV